MDEFSQVKDDKYYNDKILDLNMQLKKKNKELANINNKYDELKRVNRELLEKIDQNDNNALLIKEVVENSKKQSLKLKKLESHFLDYKKYSSDILTSYNKLFNTLSLFYDFEVKGLLKYNHLINQELLDFVVNVCNKYELDYWLDFGVLLGAVRHEGFIPWDDDVDLGMIRKDYDKFISVFDEEIKRNNLSDCIKTYHEISKNKPLPIYQIFYMQFGSIIAGIDIFPYDFIANTEGCNSKTYKKMQDSVNNNNRNGTPINVALKEYLKEFNISYDMENYIIPGIEGPCNIIPGYKFEIYETDKIYPLKSVKFQNKQYKCPNDTDYYLTKIYDNYLNIPKKVKHHHVRWRHLRKVENIEQIYETNISKLHVINESFY